MLESLRIDAVPFLLVMGLLVVTTVGVLYGMYRGFLRLIAFMEHVAHPQGAASFDPSAAPAAMAA